MTFMQILQVLSVALLMGKTEYINFLLFENLYCKTNTSGDAIWDKTLIETVSEFFALIV